jgi:hypothetical protein
MHQPSGCALKIGMSSGIGKQYSGRAPGLAWPNVVCRAKHGGRPPADVQEATVRRLTATIAAFGVRRCAEVGSLKAVRVGGNLHKDPNGLETDEAFPGGWVESQEDAKMCVPDQNGVNCRKSSRRHAS